VSERVDECGDREGGGDDREGGLVADQVTEPDLRFRALLTENRVERVELKRA
jgi:hypothetical protein